MSELLVNEEKKKRKGGIFRSFGGIWPLLLGFN